jgi:hypothetical protein
MEGNPDPDCPFCSAKLTLEHILWQCKETEEERRKNNMTKEIWEKGEEGAKMLVEYVLAISKSIDIEQQKHSVIGHKVIGYVISCCNSI